MKAPQIDIDTLTPLGDTREARGGWAPGVYLNRCSRCNQLFTGDKRAYECAVCAYTPDGIDPESREPATDPCPTLSIPLKYCIFEIWADQRTVATVFPSGHTCTGSRADTEQNRTEAESQGYTADEQGVWRSLVEHELLHNLLAEIVHNHPSRVMETESGKAFHPSWLRYYEEAQVLAAQYEINTGRDSGLPDELPWMLEGRWKKEIVPLLAPLWKVEDQE